MIRILAWLVAAMVAAVVLVRCWPNDVRAVEKRMGQLLEAVEKTGPESLPVSAARSLEAGSYLASNVVLELGHPFPRRMRRSDAISLFQQGRMQAESVRVQQRGHEIARQADGRIALDATLEGRITYRGQTEQVIGIYRFIWEKGEDGWKIAEARVSDVVQHPNGLIAP